ASTRSSGPSGLLLSPREPRRQTLGEPGFPNLALAAGDVVLDAVELGHALLEVEHQVGGTRVAVAGLAHRPGVQEPAAVREADAGPVRRQAPDELVLDEPERKRNVAVPDQNSRGLRCLE